MWWLFWNVNRGRAAVINQRLCVWQDGRLAQLFSWMKTSLVRREKTSCTLTVWRNWNSTSLEECYDIACDGLSSYQRIYCVHEEKFPVTLPATCSLGVRSSASLRESCVCNVWSLSRAKSCTQNLLHLSLLLCRLLLFTHLWSDMIYGHLRWHFPIFLRIICLISPNFHLTFSLYKLVRTTGHTTFQIKIFVHFKRRFLPDSFFMCPGHSGVWFPAGLGSSSSPKVKISTAIHSVLN